MSQVAQAVRTIRRSLNKAKAQIAGLVGRIVEASSETVSAAYEARLEKLGREKQHPGKRLHSHGGPQRPIAESFELALEFLANPCNHWKDERYDERQAVLILAF
ncbi:MAG: hypothetical protein AAGM38_06570 [Pseudomonadota bacterium]